MLFKTNDGQEKTATARELAKQTAGPNVLSRLFSDSDSQLDSVNQALNERNKDLLHERSALQEFVKAAVEIVDQYGRMLDGQLSIARAPAASHEYTEAALGHVGTHSSTMSAHTESSIVNDPLTDHELKDTTKTQPDHDDHLKQIRETIDSISLTQGAANETGIAAGVAEAETAASESLAALI